MRFVTAGSVFLCLLVGCADQSPARIEVAAPSITVLAKSPTPLGARLVNAKGEALPSPLLSFSATPVATLSVDDHGSVSCRASGDGTVVIAGGGQTSSVTVSCRIITSIRGPAAARLILGRAAETASFEAVDDHGNPVEQAEIRVTSSDAAIVRYEGGSLLPMRVGQATVTVEAGDAKHVVRVAVVELIKSEPLALADGGGVTWTLQQGSYELDLQVRATSSSRVDDGVTVSWVGTSCPDAAEATQHTISCVVPQTGSLTIRNPTVFGLGPVLNGFINLYRTSTASQFRVARAGS